MDLSVAREFEEVRLPVPWGEIAGRWYGCRSRRPILAVHGWMDNLGTWDKLLPLLPRHISVLCIDLPGNGQSSKYPRGLPYHLLEYVRVIMRIVKMYKWETVSLMGHSLGAGICFIYSSLYPATVDMLVAIDFVIFKPLGEATLVDELADNIEKMLIEEERATNMGLQEPPVYTYAEIEHALYIGTQKSLRKENCKYLLQRNIERSSKYPEKYFFVCDGRTKIFTRLIIPPEFCTEMAQRIPKVPYFVAKAENSDFIDDDLSEVIGILRRNNPHFEMHTIAGATHHVHLNNSAELAALLNPFLTKHFEPRREWPSEDCSHCDSEEASAAKSNL